MYDMHLIINTHWDREYRWSFCETQVRLAEAVDDLIDIMNRDKNFTYFHTDSQASMLDDYLEIRPERAEELKKLVKEGRILSGPWYTLPAEFLVSPESLVRNLLLGHKIAGGLGKVMKAAYNIFSWGQVSQLPQIYSQFGMNTIVFYRGLDQNRLDKLEFRWRSPDGTEALGITFAELHRLNFWAYVYKPYIFGSDKSNDTAHKISRDNLGDEGFMFRMSSDGLNEVNHSIIGQRCARDIDAALEGMDQLIGTLKDKSSTNNLLFLQGFDQENPDPIISELLEKINERIDYGKVTVSSLEDYMRIVRDEFMQNGIYDKLPIIEGEMLEIEKVADAFGPLYNGVFSARMPLKIKNFKCQNYLENYAEPSAVFAMIIGSKYPEVTLASAWKELLKNQQHDGIGGCHVDRITTTMDERYQNSLDIATTITKTALKELTANIDFSRLNDKEIGVTVYNSTQYTRSEILTLDVDVPTDWGFRNGNGYSRDFRVVAFDNKGNEIGCQTFNLENDTTFGYLKFGNVIGYDIVRVTLALDLKEIPAFGYSTFVVKPIKEKYRPVKMLSYEPNLLENEFVIAKINENGSIDFTDKTTGKTLNNINYFEDASDKGGPLIFDMAFKRGIITSLNQRPEISLIYNGPLYTKYSITYNWELPVGLDAQMKIHVPHGSEWVDYGTMERSQQRKVVKIVSEVILRENSNKLEFVTSVDNTVLNHRIRVMFPTNYESAMKVITDSHFDVVERDITVEDSTGWYEEASKTWPTQSFVAVGDEKSSALLMHHGISEYEVTDTKSRTIALTLIRAFGTAGNPTETYEYQELAQCLGVTTFNYAICINDGNEQKTALMKKANIFKVPLLAAQTTKHKGKLDTQKSFFTISDENFVVTALKKAEDQYGVVLRGYNLSDKDISFNVKCDFKLNAAEKITLEEKTIETLTTSGDMISDIKARSREIVSILIK